MKEFCTALDKLPILVKFLLAIPALDIVWGIYRILYALEEKNTAALVISIILLFIPITWIFDIVMIVLGGNVWRYTV